LVVDPCQKTGPRIRQRKAAAAAQAKPSKRRVLIRAPRVSDRVAFLAAAQRSGRLHRPWVSAPSTPWVFARYLARARSESNRGFLVIHARTRELVGVINVNNVVRGALQGACLGYYAFSPQAGEGLMSEGLFLVLNFAFRKMKLHRLEANIQPGNAASIALVRRFGFVREGFSRRYLKVRGRWRDHERWALLAEDFLQD
jgi:[ribosomal protein S5]-alanine N-acetyltransferase